jgi:hypothetical protein
MNKTNFQRFVIVTSWTINRATIGGVVMFSLSLFLSIYSQTGTGPIYVGTIIGVVSGMILGVVKGFRQVDKLQKHQLI